MDKNQILEKLKTIKYPGFNRDIISFGMVKDVVIDKNTITIILSISSQNKEKKNQLVKQISESLESDEFEIKIKVIFLKHQTITIKIDCVSGDQV